jgi:hypothetical protein
MASSSPEWDGIMYRTDMSVWAVVRRVHHERRESDAHDTYEAV